MVRKTSKAVYSRASPTQSSTSFSDNEDDDINQSTFFSTTDALAIAPAQWSSRSSFLPMENSSKNAGLSVASQLPPEILIQILRHMHSPRDLYHCMLVSRGWAECSVELLWHKPSFSTLSTLVKMIRVVTAPNQSFTYVRFIRRLNFLALGPELTDAIFSRFTQCSRLERLTLVNCTSVSDFALSRVLPSCPNLVAVDLTGVADTTDRTIIGLASSCTRLQGINLGGCRQVTDKGIRTLACHCKLLRRVKLSGLEAITDGSVSMLARHCPLLLEIDLNGCKLVSDVGIRELWMYSLQMREMRLSHCAELTDAAFPAPPAVPVEGPTITPFPRATSSEPLPPLHLPHSFDHLRMLDLTACARITDTALAGIIAVSPKIRNLALAKSTQITDVGVESICKLGKQLHYLHLGHASNITDRGVKMLARNCTRLRYIDLANCTHLTDLSVFELSTLQKLRRIGLVRVHNLTDEAIYALADRHATLERIHLSYCEQVSVIAIHFLLQRLRKLTHLSLTGIPSFRRSELQRFCRVPPQEFNETQREQFCVYSGKGISQLRDYLTALFNTITDGDASYSGEGEDDEDVRTIGYNGTEADDGEEDDEDDDEEYYDGSRVLHALAPRERRDHRPQPAASNGIVHSSESVPTLASGSLQNLTPNLSRRPPTVFGHQPIIESSAPTSPARSEESSTGNGAGFFRTYDRPELGLDAANPPGSLDSSARRDDGVLTPDLVFAEIGHGRGAQSDLSSGRTARNPSNNVRPIPSPATFYNDRGDFHGRMTVGQGESSNPSSRSAPGNRMPGERRGELLNQDSRPAAAAEAYFYTSDGASITDGHVPLHPPQVRPSGSSSTLHPSIVALNSSRQLQLRNVLDGIPDFRGSSRDRVGNGTSDSLPIRPHNSNISSESRGRSVRRTFRTTLNAAEHYASSFLFGHGHGTGSSGRNVINEGGAGFNHVREVDPGQQ
ncbi:RNI-like protein [Neolentinus lepideus HHB14362 ss-1]|uniref:RNI-like protein n=1 Tax=Neolentinus lepideus HHB14362 ss-1 TaxID=1314782 RepID=A0A165V842_9AGAM|nr:RNI-like protein [Neolentinus lepideus HHB14362 ss-1]